MTSQKKTTRKAYKAPAVVYTGIVGTRAGSAPPLNNLNDVFGG